MGKGRAALTAMHSSKPPARRDVREIAGRQVAVGFESVLNSKALQTLSVYNGPYRGSEFALDSPCFNLDAACHTLEEWECEVLRRRSVRRSKSGAFVNRVAEDQRLVDYQ
jgi:hypothetical protein